MNPLPFTRVQRGTCDGKWSWPRPRSWPEIVLRYAVAGTAIYAAGSVIRSRLDR